MRLVIATPLYPPEIGGPATYAKLLYEELPGKNIAVEVITFADVRHYPKIVRHYVYYRRVLKAARSADIVLALDPVSVGLPAMCAAQKARKPLVVKIVGDYAWEQGQQRFGVTQTLDEFVKEKRVSFPVRIFRRIQSRVARGAARIIVPSEYLKRVVMAWGISEENIAVIYNAVSVKETGAVPEAVGKLSRPLVVNVGRLVPWKHIDGVIEATAGVFGASLAIVGDGPERARLARHADEKLPGRAVLTGSLPHEDTLAVMKSADALVLNSSYEGLSHLLIEALLLGVPVIATSVGGNAEIITDGKDGLLVPSGDPPALAHALALTLSDTELRARLSTNALQSAKRFSVETMLSATSRLVSDVACPTHSS